MGQFLGAVVVFLVEATPRLGEQFDGLVLVALQARMIDVSLELIGRVLEEQPPVNVPRGAEPSGRLVGLVHLALDELLASLLEQGERFFLGLDGDAGAAAPLAFRRLGGGVRNVLQQTRRIVLVPLEIGMQMGCLFGALACLDDIAANQRLPAVGAPGRGAFSVLAATRLSEAVGRAAAPVGAGAGPRAVWISLSTLAGESPIMKVNGDANFSAE